MTKHGILHDYDLLANREASASGQTCAVCGDSPMTFQWSDYSGEAMCTQCGCPYQLKWGSEEQQAEGKYPYLRFKAEFLPIAKEYWDTFHRFIYYGMSLDSKPGYHGLISWLKGNHPEWIKGA